jgi:hypothetical protein
LTTVGLLGMDFPFLELEGVFVLLDFLILVFFFVSSTLSSGSLQTVKLNCATTANFREKIFGYCFQGMFWNTLPPLSFVQIIYLETFLMHLNFREATQNNAW